MAIPQVLGIETEYGIAGPGNPDFNPVVASSLLIGTYAGSLRKIRWDYEEETPGRDARGFELPRGHDDEDLGLANVILPNGARYYVDHAHPEFSSPECTTPRAVVRYDAAGAMILERSLEEVEPYLPMGSKLSVYKNNSDGKGNSYGTHENYLLSRATPFGDIVRDMTPFFVSRQIFTGAGKLGREGAFDDPDEDVTGYQLTQRADFFEAEVGLETTLKRPIINTRDEPHADPTKYRRLHVIIGDANMSEISCFLKIGTTSLVLKMVEDSFLPDLSLREPLRALRQVSRDLRCRVPLELADGRTMTALEMQWEYLDYAKRYVKEHDPTAANAEVVGTWEEILSGLEEDPMTLADQLDWVAKLRMLQGYRERDDLDWSDHRLQAIALQYHDVRRSKGIYHRLVATGKMRRLLTDDEIERAIQEPPEDTRAYFRGRCIERFGDQITAASWDSVIFDTGDTSLQRVPMHEPLRGTKAIVDPLLERCSDAASLVAALQG